MVRRGRPTKRETAIRRNASFKFYGMPERFQQPVPAERAPRQPSGKPLERDVLAAILAALHADPRVHIAERTQSGVFQDGDRYIRVGVKGKLDITGMLKGGRYFEIEVKRPGAKPDERQWQRIYHIREGGGIAGYVGSVEEALAILANG